MFFSIKFESTVFFLKMGNIVEQTTHAIVNAANQNLSGGGGVDGAIHKAAGQELYRECSLLRKKYGPCLPGNAVITSAFNLKAKFIIHAVGPIWRGGQNDEDNILKSCYINCLKIAKENNIHSISFPSISTGAYSFPVERASYIAEKTVIDEIIKDQHFMEVGFVLFDDKTFNIYKNSLEKIIKNEKDAIY